jgi:predicted TIM-barrel fold metal-dependent hydrolase
MFRMLDYRPISADGHVDEPFDDLNARMPEHLQRLSRRTEIIDGRETLIIPGLKRLGVDLSNRSVDCTEEDREWHLEYRNDPTGGRDLPVRIEKAESDGVWGEVVYPTRLLALTAHPDADYQVAMARIYNDFVREVFEGPRFERFLPVPIIPVLNVQDAVEEVRRVKELGFRCVSLPTVIPWAPYWLDTWEPLWAELEEVGLPISFHAFSGNTSQGSDFGSFFVIPEELRRLGDDVVRHDRVDERLATTVIGMVAAMSPLAHLIGAGVLDRHENLEFALVEAEAGWLPWALQALDVMQRNRRLSRDHLALKPSEYFQRQGRISFIEDEVAIELLDRIGEDRLMWSNDYPHDEGSFGDSERIVNKLLANVSEEARHKILRTNAEEFYRFPQPAADAQPAAATGFAGGR